MFIYPFLLKITQIYLNISHGLKGCEEEHKSESEDHHVHQFDIHFGAVVHSSLSL